MALFLADTPYIQSQEDWRVSASYLRLRHGTGRAADAALRMDYGVMEKMQARALIPYRTLRLTGGGRSSGLGDPALEILYDVAPTTSDTPLAAYGGVNLPTGDEDKGLGRGETAFSAGLRSVFRLGSVDFFANAGIEWDDEGGHLKSHFALVREIDRWLPVLEVSGLAATGAEKFITPGVIYRTWGGTELGLAFPIGMGAHAPRDGFMLRATRNFGGDRDR